MWHKLLLGIVAFHKTTFALVLWLIVFITAEANSLSHLDVMVNAVAPIIGSIGLAAAGLAKLRDMRYRSENAHLKEEIAEDRSEIKGLKAKLAYQDRKLKAVHVVHTKKEAKIDAAVSDVKAAQELVSADLQEFVAVQQSTIAKVENNAEKIAEVLGSSGEISPTLPRPVFDPPRGEEQQQS